MNVTASKSIARTGANTYAVTIKSDNNQSWLHANLYAYDFYPTGANGFSASGYSPSSPTMISTTLYGVAGNVNKWGPYSLPGYGVQTITYNVVGTGDYRLSDLYVVGVDPP